MRKGLFAALAVAAIAVTSFAAPAAHAHDGVSIGIGPWGPSLSIDIGGHGHRGHRDWDRRDYRDYDRYYRDYDRCYNGCGYRYRPPVSSPPPVIYPQTYIDQWGYEYYIDRHGYPRYTGRRY